MNAQTTIAPACPVSIGQALYSSGRGLSWVASIEPDAAGGHLIVGGPSPMAHINWRIVAVTSAGDLHTMDEHTAAARAEQGAAYPARDDTAELLARAEEKRDAARVQARAALALANEGRAAAECEIANLRPAWAKAAIVAELHEDASDSMTDYHNHRTVRTIVLCWSPHERDLFAEMRKAAALHPETAHLADADEKAEHREKYSMGAGYYLKNGWRDSSGWCVRKYHGQGLAVAGLEFSDTARGVAPVKAAAPAKGAAIDGAGLLRIEEHTHTKKGFQMFIAVMGARVDRETYDTMLNAARSLGGWYSKAWAGTPAGFAFKDEARARQFVSDHGDGDAAAPPSPAAPRAPAAGVADKLRGHAESMQAKVDNGFRDRETNTPRKARMAAGARIEGTQWERAQKIARALADAHDAGTVPAVLARVSTKAELYDLANEEKEHGGGYYDAPRLLGRHYDWRDAAKNERAAAAWGLLSVAVDPERAKAEELRTKLDALRFAKIPGYFPTPAGLVARMIESAGDLRGLSVLEPSAGSGAIADALRKAGAGFIHCVERHASLAEVLRLKGHSVDQTDFMETGDIGAAGSPVFSVDAVLMNPPFERGQDCEHVRHAWRFLKPGGVLVAIMGAGVTFRQGKPYAPFREWMDERGGELVEIPAGTFKESGTGVASVMLVMRKEG